MAGITTFAAIGLDDILSIAAGVLALVGVVAGLVGYFAKAKGDSIIAYQAREIELRDGTIARLEKDAAACNAERDRLKEENATLKELAQGSPQLIALTQEIKGLPEAIAKLIVKAMKGNS